MRRILTVILASDVAGYSRLVADREDDTVRQFQRAAAVFADLVKTHRGTIFNTAGDAIMARFDSAVDAVRCAVDIQDGNNASNGGVAEADRLLFRIGIAIGDVLVADDGDLLGDGVNIAARLESLAEPGGICMSEDVHDQVQNKLRLTVVDLGDQTLHNIPRPVRTFRLVSDRPGLLGWPQAHRWYLSSNAQDPALRGALAAALAQAESGAHVFFAPESLRAGGYWFPKLAEEIAKATAFVLLIGEKGLGAWQLTEYFEALDRRADNPDFPVVLVMCDGQHAPGLPHLRELPWIVAADPASPESVARLLDVVRSAGAEQGARWRHAAPYRGLAAMTEADSDFFFGRAREVMEIVTIFDQAAGRLPVLLGNSGVGKSSLAQAGVLASLARQGWPEDADGPAPWPAAFRDTRRWCFLTMRPGEEPVRALVEAFLRIWQLDPKDSLRARLHANWIKDLLDGAVTLSDLLNATELHYGEELRQPKPPAFLIYVDQGEEIYTRAEERQGRRFSEIVAQGLADARLRMFMSLRSDFLGALQSDEPLFNVHRKIDVAPLREAELRTVVTRPAEFLGVRFETEELGPAIARRAAEESTKDTGSLPLLSYVLDDMWLQMVKRGDAILRLPPRAVELGAVLADRADAFLASRPGAAEILRRVFTLKLATVHADGEPTRRRAPRSEFTDAEWRLVSDLADHPHRLLVTASPETGETCAEVAHEAIFRRWQTLRGWIAEERDFLSWRSELEAARRRWQATPVSTRGDALLMGLPLAQAQGWLAHRGPDLARPEREFIETSLGRASLERAERVRLRRRTGRTQALAMLLFAAIILGLSFVGWSNLGYLQMRLLALSETIWSKTLTGDAERALQPGQTFTECRYCPEMVVISAGEFMMGSPDGEPGHRAIEGPQHKVVIPNRFAMAKFEASFDEWDACVVDGGCEYSPPDQDWGRRGMPVVNVSWYDIQPYLAWLIRRTGKPYRLPTEAEWEFAARAGTTTAYYWGDEPGTGHANCDGCGSAWERKQTAPRGSFQPNEFGLHDMLGNVRERVEDCFAEYADTPRDGTAYTRIACAERVMRGGSWKTKVEVTRSAIRTKSSGASRLDSFGFRVVRTLAAP